MEDALYAIINGILTIIIPILVGMVTIWLKETLGVERLKKIKQEWDQKQELAMIAVRFAEQAYWDYDGKEKYEEALIFLSRELSQLGIKVSEETLEALIESALKQIKDEVGGSWLHEDESEEEDLAE